MFSSTVKAIMLLTVWLHTFIEIKPGQLHKRDKQIRNTIYTVIHCMNAIQHCQALWYCSQCNNSKMTTKMPAYVSRTKRTSHTLKYRTHIHVYRVGRKNAHGFLCYNFAYSQSFFIIFGTCTLYIGNLQLDDA